LNKGFDVYIDRAAQEQDTILISAGKRGVNVELAVDDLMRVTNAKWIDAA
jgi:Cys-tRNA(Pro)/Cys-tRNA(Cys) deacylase